ncbi:MAG: hypothetical protein JKY67_16665 [Pseudomonadales bacterium]|nr:hypothetical protein [Pseudomonadales bacterium]
MVDNEGSDDEDTAKKTVAPVVDLTSERERLLGEKKTRQEADLKKRFQKAMGWDKKPKKTKNKKKGKKKKKR